MEADPRGFSYSLPPPDVGGDKDSPIALCHRVLLPLNLCIVTVDSLLQPPVAPFLDVPFKDVTLRDGRLEGDRKPSLLRGGAEFRDSSWSVAACPAQLFSPLPVPLVLTPAALAFLLLRGLRTGSYFGTIGGKGKGFLVLVHVPKMLTGKKRKKKKRSVLCSHFYFKTRSNAL